MKRLSPRSLFAACVLVAAGVASAWLGRGVAAAEAPATQPNVLFIAVDDLNDWIGVLGGYAGVKTPNLDRLAKRSVLFDRAYCAAPACNPSRASLLTGVRPSTSGVYHNDQPWRPVLRDAVTLPQYFRAAGYTVSAGGKIFHGGYNDRASWEEYQRPFGSAHPPRRPLNGLARTGHFDWGPLDAPEESMGDYRLAAWAGERLARRSEKPFFLAVGFTRPHLPWYVPQPYFDRYPLSEVRLPTVTPRDLDDVPPAGRRIAAPEGDHRKVVDAGEWERAVQGYLASISFVDAQVGRVLDALEKSPHAANTLVVLWGDHGWHLGQKEHWRKFALWEEATRTPLMVAGPGIKPGRASAPVSLMDLYPTLIELCGLPKKDGLEAVSLGPLLRNPKAARGQPALTTHGKGNHALRTARWRYIRYSDGSEELYDHDADPREWRNLASDAKWAPIKRDLAKWLPAADAPDAPARGGGEAGDD